MLHLKTQAVIFDMDGVITDTMPYHFRAWQEIFHSQGILVSHEDVYKREGQKGIESVREIFEEYNKPFVEAHAHELLHKKERRFKEIFELRFIPGAREFLHQVHAGGFKLGLVTGTSRQEAVGLLPPDIFSLFEVTVCGTDVKRGKPDPEPYLTALHKMSIDALEAVVIENAPFGIRSAKAAGIRCLALATSLPAPYLQQAEAVFPSFEELKRGVNLDKDE